MRPVVARLLGVGLLAAAAVGGIVGAQPRPSSAWQPAPSQEVLGFLGDGRTVVTVERRSAADPPRRPHVSIKQIELGRYPGPVRSWDVITGQLAGEGLADQALLDGAELSNGSDRITGETLPGSTRPPGRNSSNGG